VWSQTTIGPQKKHVSAPFTLPIAFSSGIVEYYFVAGKVPKAPAIA